MKPVFEDFAEPRLNRRKCLLGLAFAATAGIAAWRQPRTRLDYLGQLKLEDLVPKKIGAWNFVAASGLVVPPQDQLLAAIYSQLLTRVYWDGQNSPIMLLLAESGSQTGFLQIHRPEFCYTASGYQISESTSHPIRLDNKTIPASTIDATTGGPVERVVYWTRIGDRMPTSWKEQRLAVAEQNLEGIVPDAILVRVSTVSSDGPAARAAIDRFVRSMLQAISPQMRHVFVA